uniref:Uncharacterized protein n=1 Tax=Meloidogyne hapla TaxID=6305 RepID=A0A1I8BR80_MELHA
MQHLLTPSTSSLFPPHQTQNQQNLNFQNFNHLPPSLLVALQHKMAYAKQQQLYLNNQQNQQNCLKRIQQQIIIQNGEEKHEEKKSEKNLENSEKQIKEEKNILEEKTTKTHLQQQQTFKTTSPVQFVSKRFQFDVNSLLEKS